MMRHSDPIPVGGTGQTLLVVEHEVLVRFHICGYLRECGFKVIEAANSDEALILLQEPDLVVDIVLSDAAIPGQIDGFGLSRWLRAYRKGMPIILVGSPGRAVEAAADLCEAGPMLARPYEPAILLDRIKRTLAGRPLPPAGPIAQSGNGVIVYP
jgi:DNA-binding response OmpR family regulator